MVDQLEKYLQEPAPTISDDHEILQQNALREVLRLTPDAINPAVTQIESIYQEHRDEAESKFNRSRKKIETQYQDQTETAHQDYQDCLHQINTEYQTGLGELETDTQSKRDQLNSRAELEAHKAEKNYEYEVMLAENCADATEKRCKQDRRNMQEAVPAAKGRLDELQNQVEGIMQLFRQPIPEPREIAPPEPVDKDKVIAVFRQQHETAQQYVNTLYALKTPQLFISIRPILYPLIICGAAVGLAGALKFQTIVPLPPFYITGPIAFVLSLAAVLLIGRAKWRQATAQVRQIYHPIQQIISEMHMMLDHSMKTTLEKIKELEEETVITRKTDIKNAESNKESTKTNAAHRRDSALQDLENKYQKKQRQLEDKQTDHTKLTEEQYQKIIPQLEQKKTDALAEIKHNYDRQLSVSQQKYDSDRNLLEERWRQGLALIAALFEDISRFDQTVSRYL